VPYELTEEQRGRYRATSIRSKERKAELLKNLGATEAAAHGSRLGKRLDVAALMPSLAENGLTSLSLFSGGGGLDLGFEQAGFAHAASYEILDICGETLRSNRPRWNVYSGTDQGDVVRAGFAQYRSIDVVHGGPPCQPFSIAGKQEGMNDPRNMWPSFIRCVLQARPRAFVAENVPGILDQKFSSFVKQCIRGPLENEYTVFQFRLSADDFGVPQSRRRVFFVGFRARRDAERWVEPEVAYAGVPRNTARACLGLPDIGFDAVAPTLRSGFTGPRKTTGVVNSKASMQVWNRLRIWPNGVQRTAALAAAYTAENGHFRMSVEDCALLQGFPPDWHFRGAVYQALGQIGNSVCPPVAYAVARQVALALTGLTQW
jgi:DNA (cytosine-5)-methyltransferase 1